MENFAKIGFGVASLKKVTIVLTTLNCDRFLRQAIDSCLNQTYSAIELLVVDGGSKDRTLEIIQSYQDNRMRLIHQAENVGKLPGAINLGLEHAQGDYLTWMQADSIYALNAIETMVRALDEHPDIGQVYADFWVIDEQGRRLRIHQTRDPEKILYRPQQANELLGVLGDPGGVCFLLRREVRNVVGIHDVDAYPVQDYDYRLRIAMRYPSLRLREPLYEWRLHPGSLTGSRSWIVDPQHDLRIRIKLGLCSKQQAEQTRGELFVAYAFDCYQKRIWAEVPKFLLGGVLRSPRHVLNRGVWAILLKSLIYRICGGKN